MSRLSFYDSHYSTLTDEVHQQVRREAFGEDLGQTSFLTTDELQRFSEWLAVQSTSKVLEIRSGSGIPALRIAQATGCSVLGLDINEIAIASANEISQLQGFASQVRFQNTDVRQPLPFEDCTFDAVFSIDTIILIPHRFELLKELYRVLRPGGRVLYTDTTVISGFISNDEIAARSFIGYYEFSPPGENERVLERSGFELVCRVDVTENVAKVSKRWYDARSRRQNELVQIEGPEIFERTQRSLSTICVISAERRLCRVAFVAFKPNDQRA